MIKIEWWENKHMKCIPSEPVGAGEAGEVDVSGLKPLHELTSSMSTAAVQQALLKGEWRPIYFSESGAAQAMKQSLWLPDNSSGEAIIEAGGFIEVDKSRLQGHMYHMRDVTVYVSAKPTAPVVPPKTASGRPKGTGKHLEDEPLLESMSLMLKLNQVSSRTEAARRALKTQDKTSKDISRLVKRYNERYPAQRKTKKK